MNGVVGLALGSGTPPEAIGPTAALAEQLGFCELWISEDCFFTGGISGAAIALGATDRVPVGLGLVSVCLRHPAVLAMECATLARGFPGRFRPGFGLGLAHGLELLDLYPRSPLRVVRECCVALRSLLAGDELDSSSSVATFDHVKLAYPPSETMTIYVGGHGPRMIELTGEVGDGTLISVFAGVEYVRWARALAAAGRAKSGRAGTEHRMPVFALCSVDYDSASAKEALAPVMAGFLAHMPRTALGDVYGITDQLVELAAGGPAAVLEGMPEHWLTDLCVVGDPPECADQIRLLLEAGGDSVVLFPNPAQDVQEIVRLAAAEVLPRL
jgi:alkanesulfonate monooxygenase SsuD/methylene tetrahydromethanopterin reductase-like flavin-dependent oxidoreductase (luciferase family)